MPGRELQERVLRIAGGFESLGFAERDVIAILMRNDFPFIEISLAASMSGISAIPINWHSKADELSYILADAAPKAIFAHADLAAGIRDCIPDSSIVLSVEIPPEVRTAYNVEGRYESASADLNYAEWVAQSRAFKGGQRAPAPYISYTSGTTGKPKAVVREVPPPAVAQSVDDRGRAAHGLDILPIRAVLPGPLYHSAPNFHALNCVRAGELLILQPRFNPGELLDIIEQHRISHIHMVPTMFSRLLNLPETRRTSFNSSSLKAVVHGAAICPVELKRKMIDWWGPVFREYYAATEVGVIAASSSKDWLRYPGTVGRPAQGVDIAIHDDNGRRLGPNEVGEIFFRLDAGAFVYYRNRPDAMAELKRGGEWLSLGDVGYVSEAGFLWITDRKKDMVVSGGVNIFPAEIEGVLISHPSVEDCAVFGVPDDDLGEVLVAVLKPRGRAPSTQELTRLCKERLGTLKTPRAFSFVEHLPREDTGKLAKRRLKAAFLESAGSV
jgi:long-chain acyl-CoA synthetase